MSKPKIIYVGHGQMVEMRICLSEYDTNYQAWQDQMRPDTMLIRVMDSREIRVSDISVNVMDWYGKVQYLPDKDKRIAELEADLLTGDKLLRKAEAKLDAVRPYLQHHFHCVWHTANCSDKCDCGLAALGEDND